ncbi:hypothetical protein ACHAXH_007958 [Discostella pseudostelligera]
MRSDPSTNNYCGGDVGSPHIRVPMSRDILKIELLEETRRDRDDSGTSNIPNIVESRDMPAENNNARTEFFNTENHMSTLNYPSGASMPLPDDSSYPADSRNLVSNGLSLPQARDTGAIIRRPDAPPTKWSDVVSSNALSTPSILRTRTSSGETLLTSNMPKPQQQQQYSTFPYYLSAGSRSQSFELESPSRQRGIPPSHPGNSSYKEFAFHSPTMYPSTVYQDFKPQRARESYSPISHADSMTTDQTSPMSSPSLSPHVSPAMNPRRQHGDGPPPIWHLWDVAENHSEPSSPHQRLHSYGPQSIPEHQYHTPHSSGIMVASTLPASSLHSPSSGSRQHHHPHHQPMMYPRSYSGPTPLAHTHSSVHHRSSIEFLKTLLRKKACLYEPVTSFAISLITWHVGRALALSRGYFTRQQLQAGVHACVASKIDEGHVTRTKVNRCMQVILNSCFHYIIPRPDGSEECGKAYRAVFLREAADEQYAVGTLPPPWNDLDLSAITDVMANPPLHDGDDDEHKPASVGKPQNKDCSASVADESVDSGGKRSVLLCFNENIRSAADVFRSHNEFIRDVAHTGNLSLSPEEWQLFFWGTMPYGQRSALSDNFHSRYFYLAGMHDRMDQQDLFKLRTTWCAKRYDHDHSFCAFAHVGINRGWLRRNPSIYHYKPVICPYVKPLPDSDDCYVNMCPLGVECNRSHSREEIIYHPESYKRQLCKKAHGTCPLGDICPDIHTEMSSHQSHGFNRQGKRHHHDHGTFHRETYSGSKTRSSATATGHSTGFCKLPGGSPMLYIDPAPLSEFEKRLVLPGLQAMFRDQSTSVYNSLNKSSPPLEYGWFGYNYSAVKAP